MGSRVWRQRDPSRRRARPVGLVTVTAVAGLVTVLSGVTALAVTFGDVPPGHPHEAGIEFMQESGVTIGCGDGSNYCPSDAVNRGQMATFMHRLSGNAEGTPPSVDAATVMGLGPDDLEGEQGPVGPAGPAGEPATPLFAVVDSGQALVRGNGVAALRLLEPVGYHGVVFEEDVSACVYSATAHAHGVVSVEAWPGAPTVLYVKMTDLSGQLKELGYSLTVFC
jgi:hypothetical protein